MIHLSVECAVDIMNGEVTERTSAYTIYQVIRTLRSVEGLDPNHFNYNTDVCLVI